MKVVDLHSMSYWERTGLREVYNPQRPLYRLRGSYTVVELEGGKSFTVDAGMCNVAPGDDIEPTVEFVRDFVDAKVGHYDIITNKPIELDRAMGVPPALKAAVVMAMSGPEPEVDLNW